MNVRRDDLKGHSSEYLNKNCFLCSEHFDASQFMNATAVKKVLTQRAVPTIFTFPNHPSAPRKKPIMEQPTLKRKHSAAFDDHETSLVIVPSTGFN